jgi:PTH1 family peptidyl-tRNA hydrolase
MVLIVGLGNPGKGYESTRHNIGFRIVDKLVDSLVKKKIYRKFNSLVTESTHNRKKLIILKPQTFMNDSGTAVYLCCRFFGKKISQILIVHDDIDIGFGELKLKSGGSTGGHKGLESIAEKLGSFEFDRLRFGLGRPPGRKDPSEYVLEEFDKREIEEVEVGIVKSLDMIGGYLKEGIEYAMNKYN